MQAEDIASYLASHPAFFDDHPEVLGLINIPHPQNGQAISLVERQSLLLRERIRGLEARVAEMVRHGEENDAIADKLVSWARRLLSEPEASALPAAAVDHLKSVFVVPYGAVRLWDVKPQFADLPCCAPVGEDAIRLASSMQAPFCGSNVGFEAAQWMIDDAPDAGDLAPASIQSLAMLPLRVGASHDAFGLLVLGSPDKDRFQITMGTAFLARIAELASAALARLRA
jgi:uncharacterized protein